MKCDELKLFLYSEGACSDKEKAELEDHLHECNECKEKLDHMKFTSLCFSSFYDQKERLSCPSPEELVLYRDDQLDEKRTTKIFMHVSNCSSCIEELAMITACDESLDKEQAVVEPPELSGDVAKGVSLLKQQHLKKRMENVLKTLVSKGKKALAPETITKIVDQYFNQPMEHAPAYALPAYAAEFDTGLSLSETAMCDITVDIGEYSVSLRAIDDILTVQVLREGKGISDVEVIVMTRSLGVRKALTGKDGIGVIVGIQQGPYQIKIRMTEKK